MVQTIGTIIACSATCLIGVGWVFKIWIINPMQVSNDNNTKLFNCSIDRLNETVNEMKRLIEVLRVDNVNLDKQVTVLSRDLKTAFDKIDILRNDIKEVKGESEGRICQ